jgi:NADH:ubiquinone oxidoreductase subunit 6 (subunit J)
MPKYVLLLFIKLFAMYESNPTPLSPQEREGASSLLLLLGAGLLTILLWNVVPYGRYILYPFTILGTWFHEMGHGVAAMLVGGSFKKLELFPNGSGLATNAIPISRIGRAITAAGGLIGPAMAGSVLIILGRKRKWAHWGLLTLGSIILLSVLIWVRTIFGVAIMTVIGAAIIAFAIKAPDNFKHFAIQFLGVQAWASMYMSLGYMFSEGANVGGQQHLSDTAAIAEQLLLPYWVWGGLISLVAIAMLLGSLWVAFREKPAQTD